MTKFGVRKPSIKRSISSRTTGRITRSVKSSVDPFYGKKGTGLVRNPSKSIYNKVYKKTTVGINPMSNIGGDTNTSVSDNSDINYQNVFSDPIDQMEYEGPNLNDLPSPKVVLHIDSKFINTVDFKDNILSVSNYISASIDRGDQYQGLKRTEIIDSHFNEKIFQLDSDDFYLYGNLHIIMQNNIYYLVSNLDDDLLKIGAINPIDNIALTKILGNNSLPGNLTVQVKNYGGKYKQTIINKDGSISVKGFYDSVLFSIDILNKSEYYHEKEKRIDEYNEQLNALKQERLDKQAATNRFVGIGCLSISFLAVLIVIIPIILLFSHL